MLKAFHIGNRDSALPVGRSRGRAFARAIALGLVTALAGNASIHADDTEIFRSNYENDTGKPKVLIIFDNSGSMDTIAEEKPAYNSAEVYPAVGGIQSGRLYWQSGNSGNPPPTNTGQYIDEQKNRCASSYDPLNSGGYFIDRAAVVTLRPRCRIMCMVTGALICWLPIILPQPRSMAHQPPFLQRQIPR